MVAGGGGGGGAALKGGLAVSGHAIIRTMIESYDPLTHTATVRPLGHPTAALQDVPVSADVPGELVPPGARALVLLFGDVGQVLLAPYGAPAEYPLSAAADYGTFYMLTAPADMVYEPHPYLSVELTVAVYSHFWVQFAGAYVAQNTRSWNLICRTLINGAPTGVTSVVDKVEVGGWYQLGMAFRTIEAYAPGTYTFEIGFLQQQTGDQVRPAGVHLTVMAFPGPVPA
jgi:hypothetical protein